MISSSSKISKNIPGNRGNERISAGTPGSGKPAANQADGGGTRKTEIKTKDSAEFQSQKLAGLQEENSHLKRVNQELFIKNQELTEKLTSITDLYNSITAIPSTGKSSKPCSNRRQILLESQIFQLKRQLKIYKDQEAEKEWFIFHSKEQLDEVKARMIALVSSISENSRSNQQSAGKSSNTSAKSLKQEQGTNSSIPKLEISGDQIKVLSDCAKKLEVISRSIKRREKDRIEKPCLDLSFYFSSDFLGFNKKNKEHTTMADIASGSIKHINLVHISRLEKTLGFLYTSLLGLEACLSSCWEPHFVKPLFHDKVSKSFEKTMEQLILSLNSIATLTPLLPVAPLPSMERVKSIGGPSVPRIMDLVDVLLQPLPNPVPESKKQKVVACVGSLVKSIQENQDRLNNQINVLNQELEYHRQVYSNYTKSISNVMEKSKEDVDRVKQDWNEKRNKLTGLYQDIQNLEWKEEFVLEFLERIELELADLVSTEI